MSSSAAAVPSPADLLRTVREVISEVRGLPPEKVLPESLLMADLGADSLDFLDVVFKLERAFDIQITRGEMERAARGDMTEEAFAPGGVISAEGLERLRTLMPEAAARIKPGMHVLQIMSLFTARTFASIVEAKRRQPG